MEFKRFFTLLLIVTVAVFDWISWLWTRTLKHSRNSTLWYIQRRIDKALEDFIVFFSTWYMEYYQIPVEEFSLSILNLPFEDLDDSADLPTPELFSNVQAGG